MAFECTHDGNKRFEQFRGSSDKVCMLFVSDKTDLSPVGGFDAHGAMSVVGSAPMFNFVTHTITFARTSPN
ncbi:hypothetical protein WT41_01575 [Burkholderia territorii]|nr:hypothetical protein WT41_01575 [Burkholderia territorii]